MPGQIKSKRVRSTSASTRGTEESAFSKWLLISIALLFALVFLLLPLVNVFAQAFSKGWRVYVQALTDPYSLAAIKLSLQVAAIAVPLNVLFGLASAGRLQVQVSWQIDPQYSDDLPFSVSPVVAGLMYVLLSVCKATLANAGGHNIRIIFAVPVSSSPPLL